MDLQHALARTDPEQLLDERVRKQGGWRIFMRFFPYLFPMKRKVALIILMTFIGVPLGQIGVFIGRYLVDEVILAVDKPASSRMWMFFAIVGIQALLWLISQVMAFIRSVMSLGIDVNISARLRKLFYAHLQGLSLEFFRTRPVGEHMYRTGEVGGLLSIIHYDGVALVDIVYKIIWGAVLVTLVDWRITVLVLLYIVPYTIMSHYAYTYFQRMDLDGRQRGQVVTAVLRDSVAGVKTVKAYGRTSRQLGRYTSALIWSQRLWIKRFWLSILTHHYMLWGYQWIVGKIKWIYIAQQTMVGNLSIGEFSVMFWLIGQLETPVQQIVQHIQNIRLHMVPAMRVLETLDVPLDITDAPDARPMPPIRGDVDFRSVEFEYAAGKPVLRGVDMHIPEGAFVAFVGPSGAGKSTLLHLLLRLYDPGGGQVLVDGIDIKGIRMSSYLDQVGVVLQETFLFGGTLADNIGYGNLRADDETLRRAAEAAELGRLVEGLPNGLETDLGEGTKLSGGEKQRIGLARALVRDPRILILDEPTSMLDSRTEAAVLQTIERVAKGRTTLMISHRLVPVKNADAIFVFDAGRVVEQGKHEELLALDGLYARLWKQQMSSKNGGAE